MRTGACSGSCLFLVGSLVPEDEPAWLVLMTLKDITELVVSPVHSDDSGFFGKQNYRAQTAIPGTVS